MRKLNINTLISIVVPVYNESGVVEIFIARIISILENIDHKYEIIFINDGSTDDTFAELEKVYKAHKNIRVITFSRNFGKEAAISAGIDYSHGDALIPIDIDLQDPPELIIL